MRLMVTAPITASDKSVPGRPEVHYLFWLLGLSVLLWLPRLGGPIDLRYDAGVYYILGTSLAEGQGYRLLSEPGDIQAVQYPPLLPALVAVHQWLLGTTDPVAVAPWLRRSFFFMFTLYVLAVYGMARHYVAAVYALLVALVAALSLYAIFLSDLLFADLPFSLATILFVICNKKSEKGSYFVLTALLGAAAYLFRTAGMALLAAWVAESCFRKRWKQVVLRTAVALVPVLAWQAYLRHVTAGEEYRHPAYPYQRAAYLCYNVTYAENILQWIDPFVPERGRATLRDLVERAASHFSAMPMSLGEAVTTGEGFWNAILRFVEQRTGIVLLPPWAVTSLITLMGCLTIAGTGALWIRRERFIPLYIALSVAQVSLTPWPEQFTRYLSPLTPFLALALMQLLAVLREQTLRHGSVRLQKATAGLAVVVVSIAIGLGVITTLGLFKIRHEKGQTYAVPGSSEASRLFFYDQTWVAFDTSLAWLKGHAQPGDIIATVAPHRTYLKTGLKAVIPPMELDVVQAQRLLDAVPVKYVIVDELEFLNVTRKYTAPTLQKHSELWQQTYSAPGSNTRVYRRVE
jgi:hypothetical protein